MDQAPGSRLLVPASETRIRDPHPSPVSESESEYESRSTVKPQILDSEIWKSESQLRGSHSLMLALGLRLKPSWGAWPWLYPIYECTGSMSYCIASDQF